MREEDELYIESMNSWFEEQDAREKEIRTTIETSKIIHDMNVKQLELHLKMVKLAKEDYEKWLLENEVE